MIWFSAESALMSINPSASGPTSMPTMRNSATSGIFIFWANRPVMTPMARMSPQESSVCFAISIEADPGNLPTLRAELARGLVEQFVHLDVPRDDLLLERVL